MRAKRVMSESREGPTPNGGVRCVAYYLNDENQPAPKSKATRVKIIEYDALDEAIYHTYGRLTN